MALTPRHSGRVTERAMDLLREVVDYGFGNSSGPNMVGRFEAAFAERFGVRNAIAVCNGTATMHCCLAAAGVKPGDEVIVPPLTAGATAFAVLHQGAIPVFADIDRRTFNIDPESIRQRLTPLTKAIIPVGLYGLSADMDPIMEIAKEHDLAVIEDNAECFLGTYKERIAGTTGHMASFSFQSSKHLTCGDGGIVTTDDDDLATAIRRFACFGYRFRGSSEVSVMSKEDRGHPTSLRHDFLGWNYRLSDLQAAVALEQTERMDVLIEQRMKIAEMYLEAIDGSPWLTVQQTPDDYVNSYWTFVCRFDAGQAGCSWDDFRNRFKKLGGDFIYGAWQLTYNEPIFQDRQFLGGSFPVDSEIYTGDYRSYEPGLCPVAEELQPQLMQFKTNYMDLNIAQGHANALKKTIESFTKG
jgi:perosamine synthetase